MNDEEKQVPPPQTGIGFFETRLQELINYTIQEWEISYGEIIGVLTIAAHVLCNNCTEEDDDE